MLLNQATIMYNIVVWGYGEVRLNITSMDFLIVMFPHSSILAQMTVHNISDTDNCPLSHTQRG